MSHQRVKYLLLPMGHTDVVGEDSNLQLSRITLRTRLQLMCYQGLAFPSLVILISSHQLRDLSDKLALPSTSTNCVASLIFGSLYSLLFLTAVPDFSLSSRKRKRNKERCCFLKTALGTVTGIHAGRRPLQVLTPLSHPFCCFDCVRLVNTSL